MYRTHTGKTQVCQHKWSAYYELSNNTEKTKSIYNSAIPKNKKFYPGIIDNVVWTLSDKFTKVINSGT